MDNKQLFLDVLESVDREGIPELVNFLESSDFFIAPASTKYHFAFEGGLCAHSLNVYYHLFELVEQYKNYNINIPQDSVIICGLLHDLSKTNYYETYVQNKKVYSPTGSKWDELGNYDWQSVAGYRVKDAQDRFMGLEHCVDSVLIASRFIKLTEEEQIAIMNHHFALGGTPNQGNISEIMSRYPLAYLLHTADMHAVYLSENQYLMKDYAKSED